MLVNASCCGHVSIILTASTIQLPPAMIPFLVFI
jgi:hypothetical protein